MWHPSQEATLIVVSSTSQSGFTQALNESRKDPANSSKKIGKVRRFIMQGIDNRLTEGKIRHYLLPVMNRWHCIGLPLQ